MKETALFTVIYPTIERYLFDWYNSMMMQSDHDYDLWVVLDRINPKAVYGIIGEYVEANWIEINNKCSPTQIRSIGLENIAGDYSNIILVDSDDILEPTRVEAAKRFLAKSDVNTCAMLIVDETAQSTGKIFTFNDDADFFSSILTTNVFGLSNTAYRGDILKACLPLPNSCRLADWYLATKSCSLGAQVSFDRETRMRYRQHGSNIARVIPPFTPLQILHDTELVISHYQQVLSNVVFAPNEEEKITNHYQHLQFFYQVMLSSNTKIKEYVKSLNNISENRVWWSHIADPRLNYIWV